MRRRTGWGLDIGSSAAKLVRVDETQSSLRFTCYGPAPLVDDGSGVPNVESVRAAVARLLSESGASKALLHCSVPRHRATIKFPDFPSAPREQLSKMVKFEAQRYVPFALDEVVLDFQEMYTVPGQPEAEGQGGAEPPPSTVQVLLAAMRRDVVAAYRRALTAAGAKIASMSLGSLGTWTLHRRLSGEIEAPLPAPGEPEGEPILILDVGGRSSVVSVVVGGVLIFSRSIGIGGEHLTTAFAEDLKLSHAEAEERKRQQGLRALEEQETGAVAPGPPPAIEAWASSLLSEVRRSAAAFTSEHKHHTVSRVQLCGGGAKLPMLADYLAANLGVRVSQIPGGALLPDPQFAEAAGQALRALGQAADRLDLVPEEVERERASRRLRLRLQVAALGVLACVAGAAYIGSQAFEERKAEQQKLAKLDAKVKAVVAEASRLNAQSSRISAQLSTLQEALRPQFPVLDVMQAASDHAPRGVWLTGLVYEKGKPLVLRGTALSHSLAAEYADDLKRSVCFLQVVPGDSNEVSIGKNKVVQFSITGVVKGNEPKPKRTTKSGSRRLRATE